jgi:carbon-monoxide dehydrogenase medium subunit
MYEFDYQKAASLEDAAKILAANEDAKLVAGGMTLIPTLKQRLAKPSDLIDLASLPGLKGITEEGGGLKIGAMTRHVDVNRSDIVKRVIPALSALAGMIGDPAVRNRGTIGGSISNNDPAADYPAAVVGLGATIVTAKREIAGDDSSPACSRPRSTRTRSSPRSNSPSRNAPLIRNSRTRPRATRLSGCSSPRPRAACASR